MKKLICKIFGHKYTPCRGECMNGCCSHCLRCEPCPKEINQPKSPVYQFFTAPEEVQRPVVEEAIKHASKEQSDLIK